jgi:AcrR family transcriptional regulator
MENATANLNTKEAILSAAIDLFSRKGYHETSVRQIAFAVGIKVSSLYNHFQRKEAILEAILEYYKTELHKVKVAGDMLENLVNNLTPDEIVKNDFKKLQASISTSRMDKIVQILLIEMYRNPKVREFYLKWYFDENRNAVKDLFKMMQIKGQIKNYDPETISVFYNALINFYYQEYFLFKADSIDTKELENKFEKEMDLFLTMIKN